MLMILPLGAGSVKWARHQCNNISPKKHHNHLSPVSPEDWWHCHPNCSVRINTDNET